MSKHGTQRYKPNKNIKRLKGKRQDSNNKPAHTTTAKNSTPIQTHTAQHITGNIHTPIHTDMATYSTNFMTTFHRPHSPPSGPLTSTTVRSNFLYRPNTPTVPIPINPLLQPTRYPLIPTTTTTATRPTYPLLSNHIQQQITNFIQHFIHIQQQPKITITKPKLLAQLQNKRNQNGNRHKTKKQLLNKIQKQKAGDNIINLSNIHVSDATKSILNKGLKFVPKRKPIGYQSVYTSYLQYRRNMYLQYHYRHLNNNYIKHPFKAKSDFTPPLPDNANLLEYMSRVLLKLKTSHELNKDSNTNRLNNNVSNAEKQAVMNLRNSEQVIVKPADKGGAIVIWPRESYIAEANKQLNEKRNYKLIETDPFPQLITKLNKIVKTFFTDQLTDYTTFKFLLIDKPIRKPTLYLLPKVHKPDVTGRQIIPGCEGPTVRLSEYVDVYLKPLIKYIPSYIKDSTDFLKRSFKLNDTLPNEFILITIDIKSLYTNIPNREGIDASTKHLNNHDTTGVNIQMIRSMLELILENNYFEFNDKYYLQTHGTAMGTTMQVSYANMFMAPLEEKS